MAEFPTKSVGEIVTAADWNQIEDALPQGFVHEQIRDTNRNAITTTATDIIIASGVTLRSSRRYLFTAHAPSVGESTTLEGVMARCNVTFDGIDRAFGHIQVLPRADFQEVTPAIFGPVFTPGSNITADMKLVMRGEGGQVRLIASEDRPAFIRVIDIGPA